MKVLLTGAAGQLGRELTPMLAASGGLVRVDLQADDSDAGMVRQDLTELEAVERLLDEVHPSVIFNAAAYTAVDQAEDNAKLAFRLNAELPELLAGWAAANDCVVVHYSTDYVFSGETFRALTEDDAPAPLNVYGQSKLAGEQAVLNSACRGIVIRTSWVYSSHGNNFLLTMLRLARERAALSIVDDQTGRPTWARNLARVSHSMVVPGVQSGDTPYQGLYHYCDGGEVTWFGFAGAIFTAARQLGLIDQIPRLTPVSSTEYPQKALRPGYSVLDTSRIESAMNAPPAGLEESLLACMGELVDEK